MKFSITYCIDWIKVDGTKIYLNCYPANKNDELTSGEHVEEFTTIRDSLLVLMQIRWSYA